MESAREGHPCCARPNLDAAGLVFGLLRGWQEQPKRRRCFRLSARQRAAHESRAHASSRHRSLSRCGSPLFWLALISALAVVATAIGLLCGGANLTETHGLHSTERLKRYKVLWRS